MTLKLLDETIAEYKEAISEASEAESRTKTENDTEEKRKKI
ncbi:hypothetical protein [Borrelia sp. A-FGy1]|nr:hypothetical protein [Borrelia sp. A-FGy1]